MQRPGEHCDASAGDNWRHPVSLLARPPSGHGALTRKRRRHTHTHTQTHETRDGRDNEYMTPRCVPQTARRRLPSAHATLSDRSDWQEAVDACPPPRKTVGPMAHLYQRLLILSRCRPTAAQTANKAPQIELHLAPSPTSWRPQASVPSNGASRSLRTAEPACDPDLTGVKAPIRMAVTFDFFLAFNSPSGHKWQ